MDEFDFGKSVSLYDVISYSSILGCCLDVASFEEHSETLQFLFLSQGVFFFY